MRNKLQVEEIKKIVESGRIWEARDRCLSLMGHVQYNEELCSLTAQVFFKMNDLPRAGLYWILTSDEGEHVEECINWAIETYKRDLPNRYRKEIREAKFPDHIRKRIDDCFKKAHIRGGAEALRYQKYREAQKPKEIILQIGCLALILVLIFFVIYGIRQLIIDIF